MKTLEDQMSFYAAYHQDARNKATHFVGVPLIVFSLMIPLGWLRADLGGFPLSAALVVTAVLLALLPRARHSARPGHVRRVRAHAVGRRAAVAGRRSASALAWFLVLFVGGWALQLWGHVYEGRKPALVDNLFQIFVAPIFLAAEVFFALGYKPRAARGGAAARAGDARAGGRRALRPAT